MTKEFDKWNEKKKIINEKLLRINFHERELWWGSIGVNIGSEQDGVGENFERPILILKKLSPTTFFGLPLSTKKKLEKFQVEINTNVKGYALLDQGKTLDVDRLDRRIGLIDIKEFEIVLEKFIKMLQIKKIEIPLSGEISEA